MRERSELHRSVESELLITGKKETHRDGSHESGAALAVIHLELRRAAAVFGEGGEQPFLRIAAGVHEFFSDEAEFSFMRLAAHPCLLSAARFFARLAVKPAHVSAVHSFQDLQLLGICP